MTDLSAAPPLARDFNAKSFEGVIVPLFLLFRANVQTGAGMVIKGRTFQGCYIEGPAVLLPVGGVSFEGCDLGYSGGDMRNLLLQPMSAEKITGAIAMQDCRFQDCRFIGVGFTGSEAFLNELMKVEDRA